MNKTFFIALALQSVSAWAQLPTSMFSQALTQAEVIEKIPSEPQFQAVRDAIAQKTGSRGDLEFVVKRMTRFTQQASCGRVAFWVSQPSSKTVWPQLGGELNICESGDPPLQECKGQGLVPHTAKCADGSSPRDTAEVQQAISDALKRGGLTHEQVRSLSTPPNKGKSK